MESKLSLRTPRQPSAIMHGCRASLSRPSTMQTSWSSRTSLPPSRHKSSNLKKSQDLLRRPHTTGGTARPTSRHPSNLELFMEGMTPLRTKRIPQPHIFLDSWAPLKVECPQNTQADRRPLSSITPRPHTSSSKTRIESSVQLPSKISRPHTATGDSRTTTVNVLPSTPFNDRNQKTSFQSVHTYSSPKFSLKEVSPPGSPKESIFDTRSLKYPRNLKESPKFGKPSSPSRAKAPSHYLLDPSLNLRSPSISTDFKVNSSNPMESLVTQMPLPPPPPTPESSTPSTTNMLRKQIEAALRMYPRNTWGPVTKWGYLEDFAPGEQQQKDHFINNNEKLEKQRLASRNFGHKRHWVKFKNLTNLWEQHEAQQSAGYVDEKERFLTNSENMLRIQNHKRIAIANGIVKARREKNVWHEFQRLEKREGEYIDQVNSEQKAREDGRTRSNDSAVIYNMVTLEYPNNYAGDLLRFEDAQIRWRQRMRALRIQSKQSGARMFNVMSWKPHKPCCVPPLKPNAPQPPDPNLAPSPRKPELPLPRNMLYLDDKCDNVPVGSTNDMRTDWYLGRPAPSFAAVRLNQFQQLTC